MKKNNLKTLVIGASTNPVRYSNMATKRLLDKDHQVVAYGLKEGKIGSIAITQELPIEGIDTVTLYLNPKNQEEYYNYLVELNPRRVIFNPGTENPNLINLLKQSNISFEVACTLVLLNTDSY